MNLDDPKLTAYALGELDEPERTAMEERLRNDPAAAAEVTALRDFTARLRAELHTEKMPGLTEDQRAEVFAAAKGASVALDGRAFAAMPEISEPEILRPSVIRWRLWIPAAIAACAAIFATCERSTIRRRNRAPNCGISSNSTRSRTSGRLKSRPCSRRTRRGIEPFRPRRHPRPLDRRLPPIPLPPIRRHLKERSLEARAGTHPRSMPGMVSSPEAPCCLRRTILSRFRFFPRNRNRQTPSRRLPAPPIGMLNEVRWPLPKRKKRKSKACARGERRKMGRRRRWVDLHQAKPA